MKPARLLIVIVVVALLLIVVTFFVLRSQESTKKEQAPTSQLKTAAPTRAPLPTPVTAGTLRGRIVSMDQNSISVKVGSKTQTVSLEDTRDFQKVVSGSIDAGNAKIAKATKADLKVGQEVMIAIDQKTSKTLAVFILK